MNDMLAVLILLVLGLIFIVLEFYLPGIILGTIGGIMLLTSIVLFANTAESLAADLLYFIVVITLVALVIKYTLRSIPRAGPSFSIYLDKDQEGYRASKFDASAIGKKGSAITDLKPGGYILVEGKKQQAISQSGYITRGSEVIVLRGQEESLIVKSVKAINEDLDL